MQLHIIGGFLGSGKTTAIIGAARHLASQGKQVGVITNDQGRHLVDTEILRAEQLPTMEVSGGCFCCHFDDLNDRLRDLIDQHHPDVIFAESVGSCADVVATVVRPLLEMEIGALKPSSYTVFADARLLDRYLHDMEMPFSEGINYIFGKQIEEAGLLFINKTDLLDVERVKTLQALASTVYPAVELRAGCALSRKDIIPWIDAIQEGRYPPPVRSLDIDYDFYAIAEGELAWVDRAYQIHHHDIEMQKLLHAILSIWSQIIQENGWIDGHIKVTITTKQVSEKISLAQSGEVMHAEDLISYPIRNYSQAKEINILLNMLVSGDPSEILNKMQGGIDEITNKTGVDLTVIRTFNRVPGYPKPTYRIP